MGRERTRTGKHIYFCAACLIFFLSGCTTIKESVSWISKEDVSAQKVQDQQKPAKPSEDILRARELFDRGDFSGSLKESQEILLRSSKDDPRDQALFLIGLIYAHAENPQKDLGKALYSFRTVLKEYPQSHLTAEARVLVGVLQENQKLGQMARSFKQENEELNQAVQKAKQENEKMNQAVQKVKQENEELSRVIEKSKQVDIEVEEKKREKAR